MNAKKLVLAGVVSALTLASSMGTAADTGTVGSGKIKHVLLLSIDGMHEVDFYNCARGIAGANGGNPYCPNMAALGQTARDAVPKERMIVDDNHGDQSLHWCHDPSNAAVYASLLYSSATFPPIS